PRTEAETPGKPGPDPFRSSPAGWRTLFRDATNQVRLQLFVLAYNLGNFLRQAVLPRAVRHWTLTTLREKLIKIGAQVVRHARQVIFQMAEVAVPRELFRAILQRIGQLRLPSPLPG
ncbi:MAG: transposase, partial [Verrucomicrobiota bacterium]